MKELKDKVVVITGSASGIGKALAKAFQAEGARPVLVDIDRLKVQSAAEELRGAPFYLVDVTDPGAVTSFAVQVEEEIGPVDILINCAGVAMMAEIADTTLEDWQWVLGVNLWGPIHMIGAFLPRMYERASGHIVNIASASGVFPLAALGAYTTSKFALVGLSETLAMEAKDRGVVVTLVCPWSVRTPIIDHPLIRGYNPQRVERMVHMAARFMKDPDELAKLIVRAVREDKPILIHTLRGKCVDLLHRGSRRLFMEMAGFLHRRIIRRLFS